MKKISLILIVLCCNHFLVAQDSKRKSEIQFKNENSHDDSQIDKIQFMDSLNRVVREFKPDENNPFSDIKKQGISQGSISQVATDEGNVRQVQSYLPSSSKLKSDEILNREVFYVETPYNLVQDSEKNVQGIVYKLRLLDENHEEVGSTAQLQLFDNQGKIKRIINTDTDVSLAVSTKDGNFVGYTYGGAVDHYWNEIYDEGFSVYNVSEGSKILDHIAEEGYTIGRPFTVNNYIVFALSSSDKIYYVINPEARVLYKKKYSKAQLFRLKSITTEGFIFENGIKHLYNREFQKTSF